MNDKILGFCGLYCPGCGIYQTTAKGQRFELEKGVFITCRGCNSEETSPWCTDSCGIKKCSRNKGFRYCLLCEDYPCKLMEDFIHDPKYPYHTEVTDNMKRLQSIGQDLWIDENEKKYTCKGCGEKFNWFEKSCSKCKGQE